MVEVIIGGFNLLLLCGWYLFAGGYAFDESLPYAADAHLSTFILFLLPTVVSLLTSLWARATKLFENVVYNVLHCYISSVFFSTMLLTLVYPERWMDSEAPVTLASRVLPILVWLIWYFSYFVLFAMYPGGSSFPLYIRFSVFVFVGILCDFAFRPFDLNLELFPSQDGMGQMLFGASVISTALPSLITGIRNTFRAK